MYISISKTVKYLVFIAATLLALASCTKDEDAWLSLQSEAVYFQGLGETQTMSFEVDNVSSISIPTVPAGWTVEADLSTRIITITSPQVLGGESTSVRSGTVSVVGLSGSGSSVSKSFLVAVVAAKKDLSDMRSNSYILTEPYTEYTLDVTRKAETDEALTVAQTKIIWQSHIDLVRFGSSVPGKFSFYLDGDGNKFKKEGNALVGAYDGNGNLLWSWHLWIVDKDDVTEQTYANGKTFMSLNLGAEGNTNKTNEEVLASYGLFYQWGRKDPFVGPKTYNAAKAEDLVVYDSAGNAMPGVEYVASSAQTGTAAYALANPKSFILGVEASAYDWMYTTHSDALWADRKTVDDPCPKGWRVPSKGDFAGLQIVDAAAGLESQYGWTLTDGTVTAYYPAAGFRPYLNGHIQNLYSPAAGVEVPKPWVGYYWTDGMDVSRSMAMYFWFDAANPTHSGIEVSQPYYRSNGMQIRCVKQ